jgi:hypothetical protein
VIRMHTLLASALACAALALPARAGSNVGASLPAAEISDFAQTKAKSIDDFAGRALLVEFFAFW